MMYILKGNSGEYSGWSCWNVRAYSTKEKAQADCDHLNQELKRLKEALKPIWDIYWNGWYIDDRDYIEHRTQMTPEAYIESLGIDPGEDVQDQIMSLAGERGFQLLKEFDFSLDPNAFRDPTILHDLNKVNGWGISEVPLV